MKAFLATAKLPKAIYILVENMKGYKTTQVGPCKNHTNCNYVKDGSNNGVEKYCADVREEGIVRKEIAGVKCYRR